VGGDTVVVVVRAFVKPKGARPLNELRYPPIPADALKSLLSSDVIECHVAVTRNGQAAADCGGNSRSLPAFILRQAREILERAHWQPATDDQGDACSDLVTVRFRWH
jgi:hypothetical protein